MILLVIIVAYLLPPKIAITMLGPQKTVLRTGKAPGGIKAVTMPI